MLTDFQNSFTGRLIGKFTRNSYLNIPPYLKWLCCYTTLWKMNVRNTLQAKWLIRSYAPFALDFCPQRCKTRWISKITCLLRTETATNRSCVNRQINLVYYQLISNCCRPVLTYWLTDWHHQWLTVWLLIMYGILLQHLFFVIAVVYSR